MRVFQKRLHLILLLLFVFCIAFIVIFIKNSIPVSPSPDYDLSTYEEFSVSLDGWAQKYLLPKQEVLQVKDSSHLYRIFLKDRTSYEPIGYYCGVWDSIDRDQYIISIWAKSRNSFELNKDTVQSLLYRDIEIFCERRDASFCVEFCFEEVYYHIETWPRAKADAIEIAKDMIDSKS